MNSFGIDAQDGRFCKKTYDCGPYQLCIDSQCEFQPNYKYSDRNNRCEAQTCERNSDCKQYDRNRICSNGQCICNSNFTEGSVSRKCEKYCHNLIDCDKTQFCFNNRCKSHRNYRYSKSEDKCVAHICKSNDDCNQDDRNRICCENINRCECDSDYVLNPKTSICEKIVKKRCNTSDDCDDDLFCINNSCECQSSKDLNRFYKYNQFKDSCELKFCKNDSDCNAFDKNSVCTENKCVCHSEFSWDEKTKICTRHHCRYGFTLDSNTKICKFKFNSYDAILTECVNNQLCVKNRCECKPNYVFNNMSDNMLSKYCVFKQSNNDINCNQFDSNRVCYNGDCDCEPGYKVGTNTQLF